MPLRLTSDLRDRLFAHARSTLTLEDEEAAEAKAHSSFLLALTATVSGVLPAEHRTVLATYGYMVPTTDALIPHYDFEAQTWTDLLTNTHHGMRHGLFCFCLRDVRAVPKRGPYASGCHRTRGEAAACGVTIEVPSAWANGGNLVLANLPNAGTLWQERLARPALTWLTARRTHDTARNQVLGDLRAMFRNRGTFESVLADWPAAAALADEVGAERALDDDAMARIRKAKVVAPKAD